MDNLLGLLRIRVKRGNNLAVRDLGTSDPYVVITMGKQVCYSSFDLLKFGYMICYFPPVSFIISLFFFLVETSVHKMVVNLFELAV